MWKYFEAACNAGQAIGTVSGCVTPWRQPSSTQLSRQMILENVCPAVLEESVFVGSAAGRIKDFADSDM